MTPKELSKIGVFDWKDIRHKYNYPDLLLGNGFSVNINPNLTYNSLFSDFIVKYAAPLDEELKQFNTTNFELILKQLRYATEVNEIFGLDTKKVNKAISRLKEGLIQSIRDVHYFNKQEFWTHLNDIVMELDTFNNIYTTNYDLFLYYIILISIDYHKQDKQFRPYQDYFWNTYGEGKYNRFMNYQKYKKYKHVYYLHGSLFIFKEGVNDLKIKLNGSSDDYLEVISNCIESNNFPLFVSEGTNLDKQKSIGSSNYLTFCLQNLEMSKNDLLVYGQSLSKVDAHILRAIQAKPRNLIISIYPKGLSQENIKNLMESYKSKFPNFSKNIDFIDSRSLFQNNSLSLVN